jgi:LysM repeat protein
MKTCSKAFTFTVRLQTIVLLILAASLFLVTPARAQEGGVSLGPAAQQIFNDVNQARVDHGLPPLALNAELTLAAQRHVDDIIANGNWGHYGSDGSNVRTRTARAGYGSSSVSENWVAVASPERAIVWWMNDWIHRVNILGGHWDDIGVGAGVAPNGFYIFVTDFGNADGSPPSYVTSSPASGRGASATSVAVERVPPGGMDYTVVAGDTLLGIAIRYGLDWQDIAIANNMKESDLLQIGQVLRLPSIGGVGGRVDTSSGALAGKQRYTVAAGDTLVSIGLRYGVTWQELAAVNGLGEFSLLQIGQELALPASLDKEEEPPTSSETEGVIATAPTANANEFTSSRQNGPSSSATTKTEYTVRSGDTALAIALSHKVSLQDLYRANNLTDRDYLQIGQVLIIPGAGDAETVNTEDGVAPAQKSYTVRTGDTVFAIALRLGVDWQEMLRVNNLTGRSLLQPGQTLIVP